MAKKVFQDKRKLFTGKMNLELKKRIVKCLPYAAETWTLREADRMKIEAFEMWIWRQAGEDYIYIYLYSLKRFDSITNNLN